MYTQIFKQCSEGFSTVIFLDLSCRPCNSGGLGLRFDDKLLSINHVIARIKAVVTIVGNLSKQCANSSMHDFIILKSLKVNIKYRAAPKIVEVTWIPLNLGQSKSILIEMLMVLLVKLRVGQYSETTWEQYMFDFLCR
ncbi:hypothetical protein Lal_00022208 [Lupinus albus]|nr:hypothetical protein Lal_00022208 [Lupinus albus]